MAEDFNSGSIQDPAVLITRYAETYAVKLTLKQGAGDDLVQGQEVIISSSGTVSKRTLGTQFAIGTILVGRNPRTPNNKTVAVSTFFTRDIYGNSAAALAAGAFVVQDGTLTDEGRPGYKAAASGDFVTGVVLTAASGANQEVRVGVLRAPFKL